MVEAHGRAVLSYRFCYVTWCKPLPQAMEATNSILVRPGPVSCKWPTQRLQADSDLIVASGECVVERFLAKKKGHEEYA